MSEVIKIFEIVYIPEITKIVFIHEKLEIPDVWNVKGLYH